MAIRASEKVYECRQNLADLFGITDPLQIVFTSNATESLNIGLKGWLRPGDHGFISFIIIQADAVFFDELAAFVIAPLYLLHYGPSAGGCNRPGISVQ
jgi:hypothetical protein